MKSWRLFAANVGAHFSAPGVESAELSGSSSAVERELPKLDVAGSIPVSRSIRLSLRLPSAKRKLRSWQAMIRENVLSERLVSRRLANGESKGNLLTTSGTNSRPIIALRTE